MSFAALKKQSKAGSLTERLMKKVEKLNEKGGSNTDERLWKPAVDKAGNGFAIIRFLPAHANAELPWTQVWSHAFQGPGGWYIENSLTTLGKDDPVGQLNRTLWNSGKESDKDIARKQKRKLSYYANVYVVKDSSNPENEGQVKLYKFGKVEALLDDDSALETIYDKIYDLSEFTAPDQFKSYDELKARLDSVLGAKKVVTPQFDTEDLEDLSEGKRPSQAELDQISNLSAAATETTEDEDDALSYFQKLAEE